VSPRALPFDDQGFTEPENRTPSGHPEAIFAQVGPSRE
jgi:hypothetical protein